MRIYIVVREFDGEDIFESVHLSQAKADEALNKLAVVYFNEKYKVLVRDAD